MPASSNDLIDEWESFESYLKKWLASARPRELMAIQAMLVAYSTKDNTRKVEDIAKEFELNDSELFRLDTLKNKFKKFIEDRSDKDFDKHEAQLGVIKKAFDSLIDLSHRSSRDAPQEFKIKAVDIIENVNDADQKKHSEKEGERIALLRGGINNDALLKAAIKLKVETAGDINGFMQAHLIDKLDHPTSRDVKRILKELNKAAKKDATGGGLGDRFLKSDLIDIYDDAQALIAHRALNNMGDKKYEDLKEELTKYLRDIKDGVINAFASEDIKKIKALLDSLREILNDLKKLDGENLSVALHDGEASSAKAKIHLAKLEGLFGKLEKKCDALIQAKKEFSESISKSINSAPVSSYQAMVDALKERLRNMSGLLGGSESERFKDAQDIVDVVDEWLRENLPNIKMGKFVSDEALAAFKSECEGASGRIDEIIDALARQRMIEGFARELESLMGRVEQEGNKAKDSPGLIKKIEEIEKFQMEIIQKLDKKTTPKMLDEQLKVFRGKCEEVMKEIASFHALQVAAADLKLKADSRQVVVGKYEAVLDGIDQKIKEMERIPGFDMQDKGYKEKIEPIKVWLRGEREFISKNKDNLDNGVTIQFGWRLAAFGTQQMGVVEEYARNLAVLRMEGRVASSGASSTAMLAAVFSAAPSQSTGVAAKSSPPAVSDPVPTSSKVATAVEASPMLAPKVKTPEVESKKVEAEEESKRSESPKPR